MKRFKNNGNGTITDKQTGLTWLKDANDYNKGKTQIWADAQSGCKKFEFAGKKDWRLPTAQELFSIVNFKKYYPAINSSIFINTQHNWYWTSTETVPKTDRVVIVVGFNHGYVNANFKTHLTFVRPVRGCRNFK